MEFARIHVPVPLPPFWSVPPQAVGQSPLLTESPCLPHTAQASLRAPSVCCTVQEHPLMAEPLAVGCVDQPDLTGVGSYSRFIPEQDTDQPSI